MAAGRLFTLDIRHEEKMTPVLPEGVKMRPGDDYDRRLPLSYKGQQNAFETGQKGDIVPSHSDIILVDRSNLVRTTMTAQHMLAGAGYNPDGEHKDGSVVIWNPEDPRIGLSNSMDFAHPELPAYKSTLPEADNYVKGMLKDFWAPKEGAEASRPVAAKVAYALLDNRVRAIERLLPDVRQGIHALHLQVIHAPLIDSLDAALFMTVRNDNRGLPEFNIEKFPGHYGMGTFIRGGLHEINFTNGSPLGDNPVFNYEGKRVASTGAQRSVTYTLDQMKELREQLHNVSEGRF